ncbi:MAG: hypothetical protein LKJ76_10440 [Lachnospiraceae bacterium]|nr:hypothetical protein [Lachnospiraceae bacterium]
MPKNAGDFWRRWHITLGAFFRDYIFYPASLCGINVKLMKAVRKKFGRDAGKLADAVFPLLWVWIANGLWHGPKWNYILYGMYYFCLILAELIVEKPLDRLSDKLHFSLNSVGFRIFRGIKLMFIVSMGEMLFRAEDLASAGEMLHSIFHNFDYPDAVIVIHSLSLNNEPPEVAVALSGLAVMLIVDILKERKFDFYAAFCSRPAALRWTMVYCFIMAVIVFGAYGPGFDEAAMIYAGF